MAPPRRSHPVREISSGVDVSSSGSSACGCGSWSGLRGCRGDHDRSGTPARQTVGQCRCPLLRLTRRDRRLCADQGGLIRSCRQPRRRTSRSVIDKDHSRYSAQSDQPAAYAWQRGSWSWLCAPSCAPCFPGRGAHEGVVPGNEAFRDSGLRQDNWSFPEGRARVDAQFEWFSIGI